MNDAGKIAFTPKGDYDSTATYEYLDTVVYDGNSYAALKTTTGNTPTDDSEYWKLLVRGGNSVPIATEDINGVVKASEDIGVDSNAKMVLKTDYTEQTELTEIESGETRKTFFGKIAKAISTLVNHININATSAKAGHVKLSNSSAVTDSTGLALPATEKNASIEGTLANQIANIRGLDLIWYNTGSNFNMTESYSENQSVAVPEEYDEFMVFFNSGAVCCIRNVSTSQITTTHVLNINTTTYVLVWAKRTFYISDTTNGRILTFEPCYYRTIEAGSSYKLANGTCIPIRIYGIKG
jgi:hypothetical protein